MRRCENLEKILSASSSSTGTTRIEWWRWVTFSKLKGPPVWSSRIYMRYSENIEKILSGSSSSTGTTRIEWWRRVTFSKLKGLPVLSSWIYWRRCENFYWMALISRFSELRILNFIILYDPLLVIFDHFFIVFPQYLLIFKTSWNVWKFLQIFRSLKGFHFNL